MPEAIPPIHAQYNWHVSPHLDEEQLIALGRCNKPESFYDMVQSMLHNDPCVFCNRDRLHGRVDFENDSWYIIVPPGEFNRHKGALLHKFVIVLKRHTDDPSTLSDAEVLELQACRRHLKTEHDCYNPDHDGMSYMRHGSTVWNAGTVGRHLHENVDEPNGLDEIRPPVYKGAPGWQKDYDRAAAYLTALGVHMTKDEFVHEYRLRNSSNS